MNDDAKTKEQLLAEVQELRSEVNRYKALEIEHKEREDRLLQLEKAVETMPLGLTITDLEGKILYTNPTEAAIHGYQVEELLGKNAGILAPPELRNPRSLEQVKKWRGTKRESVNVRKDGTTFPVWLMSEIVKNAEGEPYAIVTSCEDITDRKQMDVALRESEEQYRTLFESLQDIFFRIDTEGNMVLASPSIVQLLGYTQEDATNLNMGKDIFVDLDQWNEFSKLMEADGRLKDFEVRLKRWDGSVVWVSATSQWYTDIEGRILGIEGMFRDINERKQMEEELQKYRDTLKSS